MATPASIIDCFRTDRKTIVTVARGKGDKLVLTLAPDDETMSIVCCSLTKKETARLMRAITAMLTNTEDEV